MHIITMTFLEWLRPYRDKTMHHTILADGSWTLEVTLVVEVMGRELILHGELAGSRAMDLEEWSRALAIVAERMELNLYKELSS